MQLLFLDLLFQELINTNNNDNDSHEKENSMKHAIVLTKIMMCFIKKKILTLNALKIIENNDCTNTLLPNGKLHLTLLC